MRTISCKLEDLKNMTLHIGYEGENDYTSVRIDAGSVFAQYPEAVPSLKVQPPKGNMYPVIVTRDGDIVIWNVSDSDTASNGNGEIQLTFTENTVVVKSCTGKTLVHRSLKATGPAPDPLIDFIDRAEEVVGEAQDAAEAAEAAAQHAPMIGLDGYWYKWDAETEGYVKTDTKARGEDGANGVGITSVEKISTVGLVDTYRINFTNGTNTTYTVTNGQDGSVPIDDTTPAANKVFSSAKVEEMNTQLLNAIQGKPEVKNSDAENVDMDIVDENGNVILRFEDGNIQTKEFDSKKASETKKTNESGVDLDFADENGNVIFRFQNGHIKTKYFNSEPVKILESTGDNTDRADEILAILQNNGAVTLGIGEFYINSSITLPEGTAIKGQGDNTVVIAGNSSMTSVFDMTDENTIENISMVGTLNSKPSAFGSMHGITILQNNCNNRVLNVNFTGFSGAGVYSIDTYTNSHNSNIISNCRFIYCGCGIYVGRRSEAFVVIGCVVLASYIGIHCIGGNNRIIADIVRGCTYGIDMTSTSSSDNDGHSLFSTLTIIHNTHAVKVSTIEYGSVFNGCSIFYGDISIENSTGIMFVGCEMGSITAISATGTSAGGRISNCIFNAMESSVVSGMTINDCTKLDGTSFA